MQEIKRGAGLGNASDKKTSVAMAQRGLASRGFEDKKTTDKTPCKADGLFGPGTENAAKAFQADSGLVADGVIGVQTWAALDGVAVEPDVVIEDAVVENKKVNGYYVADYIEYNEQTGKYVAYRADGTILARIGLSHIAGINGDFFDAVSGVPIRRVTNATAADKTEKSKPNDPRDPNFTTLNADGIPVGTTDQKPVFDAS